MGLSHSPGIVTSGLIYALDAANTRSYAGSGITANSLVGGTGSTLVNGVGFSSANNGSFFFDGTNDFLLKPADSLFNFGTGNFTISSWIKTSTTSYTTIFGLDDTGGGGGIYVYTSQTSGVMRTWVAGNSFDGNIVIANGNWRFVSVVRISGTVYQFVDTSVAGSFSAVGSVLTNQRMSVGRVTDGSYPFSGNIANTLVYNRALSATEIRQNFNATRKRYGI
jgi:hypothetical protein